MKKMICFFSAIALMLAFSCKNLPKVNSDSEMLSLHQAANDLLKVFASKDFNRFMDFYDTTAMLISSPNIYKGKEEVRKGYSNTFALPNFSINGQVQNVQISKAGDIGFTIIPYDLQYNAESGELIKQHGINVLVWKKQVNGSWNVLIDKP
jgi:ketosteroid isomerase-like protein